MLLGFVCPLVAYGKGYAPLIYKLARDAGVPTTMAWRTTSGTAPLPFAVGIAEATVAQFNALDARTDLWVVAASNRAALVNSIPVATRNKLQNLMSANGIVADIRNNDTLQVAFDKLIQAIGPDTLQDVIDEFNTNHGQSA